MTFKRPKPSMREVKRAGIEEMQNRLEVLTHLNAIVQRLGGRVEFPQLDYDMTERANIDVRLERGVVVFQVKGWEKHALTWRQKLALRLLDLG